MNNNGKITNYKVTLEVRGPVFIGSGQTISKKDSLWVFGEKKVYVLDMMKVFDGLKKVGLLKAYEDYLLDPRQKNFTDFIQSNSTKLSVEKCRQWAAYSLTARNIAESGTSRSKGGGSDDILAFMKDQFGCPYIPGSSLKGALRTIIQGAEIINDRRKFSGLTRSIEGEELRSRPRYLSNQEDTISDTLFNTLGRNEKRHSDAVNDCFAGMRISDSAPLTTDDLILCQKVDVDVYGKEHALPIRRECLKPGTRIQFHMEIDESMFKYGRKDILNFSDIFYDDYFDSFLGAFGEIDHEGDTNKHLLMLGGGTGYATKTSTYSLYDDKDAALRAVQRIMIETTSTRSKRDPHKHINDENGHKVSPHMRKCTRIGGELYDFGLCEVQITSP